MRQDFHRPMRTVALEEHFSIPELVARLPAERLAAQGNPPPAQWPALIRATHAALVELGASRIADLDANGITVQVLAWAGSGADILDGADAAAWASDCNDALASRVAAYPDRLAGFAHLPVGVPQAAADELERCVRQLGFKGAMINGTTQGRFLDHPDFAPLLTRFEQLDVPLYLHPNLPPPIVRQAYYADLPGSTGFDLATYGMGWHAEVGLHVLRLVLSGTLDRHPRLKLIIGHMGEFLPMTLARTDQLLAGDCAHLQRPIARQLREQVWLTTSGQFTLPLLRLAIDTFGIDRVLFSVDYPFSSNAEARAFLDGLDLAPADLAKISHGNADRLLKLTS